MPPCELEILLRENAFSRLDGCIPLHPEGCYRYYML